MINFSKAIKIINKIKSFKKNVTWLDLEQQDLTDLEDYIKALDAEVEDVHRRLNEILDRQYEI